MNTHQLQCAIGCDVEMNRKIIGVYAADEKPQRNRQVPYGFIVNTDPLHLPGKHWIACYINKRNMLETFDSYGMQPNALSPFITSYMKTFQNSIMNTKRLQSSNTAVCGQYCLFYLMCRCRGYTQRDIMNIFSRNFKANDEFVYNFIEERFFCCIHPLSSIHQICTCINKI